VRMLLSPSFWVPFLALMLVLVGVAALWRRRRRACFWVVWFFIFLAPVSNLVPLWNPVAGRYLYLPLTGLCVAAVLLLFHGRERWQGARGGVFYGLLGVVILCHLSASMHYTGLWKDARTLWSQEAQFFPWTAKVRRNLGLGYQQAGQTANDAGFYAKAEHEFKLALALDPKETAVHSNLGYLYILQNDLWRANEQYALAIEGSYPPVIDEEAFSNLGLTFLSLGEQRLAAAYFAFLIERLPGYVDSYVNLASLYLRQGKVSQAAELAQQALDRDRYNVPALLLFADAMEQLGQNEVSEATLRYALGVAPSSPDVIGRLTRVLNRLQRFADAIEIAQGGLQRVSSAAPAQIAAIDLELGRAYGALAGARKDDAMKDKALKTIQEAAALAPGEVEIHMNAGLVLADMKAYDTAIDQFQAALKLREDLFLAHCMVGQCYQQLGRPRLAIVAYAAALEDAPDAQSREHLQQLIQQLTEGLDTAPTPPAPQGEPPAGVQPLEPPKL